MKTRSIFRAHQGFNLLVIFSMLLGWLPSSVVAAPDWGITNMPLETTETVTLTVSASSDDAWYEDCLGCGYRESSIIQMIGTAGGSTPRVSTVGWRFTDVPIPQGAEIQSARVSLVKQGDMWINWQFNWHAEATGDAPTFSSSNTPEDRPRTVASVSHNDNVMHLNGVRYELDEIASVVQEVINRPDWASGNALVVIARADWAGWARKAWRTYDYNPSDAAQLVITYVPPQTPTPTAMPTATPTNTPTATATPTATPTNTSTPTTTATPTNTPTATTTPTATPTNTPTPTTTATPTHTPTPTSPPTGNPELTVDKSAPALAFPGDIITYTLGVTNVGSDAASGATVTDTLPSAVAFITTTVAGVVYLTETHQVVWEPGTIAAGETVAVNLLGEMQWETSVNQTVTNEAVLTSPGGELQVVSATTVISANQVTEGDITPAGGSLTSDDGRVTLDFPADAVTETTTVRITSYTEEPRLNGDLGMYLRFDLDVVGQEGTQFAQPITLTVDVTGLVEWPLLPGRELRLGYLYADGTRQPVSFQVVEGEALLLQARLNHFSMVGGWIEPKEMEAGWQLLFNDAQVSLFSGAMTYNYPIAVPPGRRGVQPGLSLSYNSKRVDGLTTWAQSDWAGLGWSIDTVEVTRHIERGCDGNPAIMCYENEFNLLINGTSYRLVKVDGPPQGGRYRTEEASFLRVERHNAKTDSGGSPQNLTGEYWTIHLPDGTLYRLGYRPDAEQVVGSMYYYANHWQSNEYYFNQKQNTAEYAGKREGAVAFRWRLDRVTDVYDNEMELSYQEEQRDGYGDAWSLASYLDVIRYNQRSNGEWGYRVVFNRENRRGGDDLGPDSNDVFYQAQFLRSIQVWRGETEIVREYLLDYELYDNPGHIHTRLLKSITPYGRGGATGGQRLPATTFTFTPRDNKGKCYTFNNCPNYGSDGNLVYSPWDQEGFAYGRLTRVDNGYGGAVEIGYEDDGRSGFWQFYNYRVKTKRVHDGRSTGWMKTGYSYGPACYNQYSESDKPGDATLCPQSGKVPGVGSLVGHRWAETMSYDYNETTILAMTRQEFHVPADKGRDWRLGRAYYAEQRDGQGKRFSYAESNWTEETLVPGVHFVYLAEQRTFTCDGDATCRRARTTYAYNPAYQGGTQYGNLTDVYEYGEGTAPYRHTRREYVPADTAQTYIVDRMAAETLYNGDGHVVAATRYLYDGQACGAPPTKGDTTEVRQLSQVSPEAWLTTATTEYNSSYGYPEAVTDANGNRTVTAYEGDYHLYPIRVSNALSHVTTYEYDYALGVVTRITDPNGAVTSADYDAFGRLTHLWRPGDAQDAGHDATQVINYNDVNPSGVVNLRVRMRVRDDAGGSGTASYLNSYTFYDGLGRAIQTQSEGEGNPILSSQFYNAQGQVERASLPYYGTTLGSYQAPDWDTLPAAAYTYDALGRTTRVVNADGTSTSTAYDNWTTTVTDANTHRKAYENDAFGRLVTVREYTGESGAYALYATTRYTYDVRDNLVGVTDALGNTTVITYDVLGRKVAMDDPDMGRWSYTYDNVGNLSSQTDAAGRTLHFEYDSLNRPTDKLYPSGSGMTNVHYSYDAGSNGIGRRTGMTDGSGSTQYTYDARGRLLREVKAIEGVDTYATAYTYDDMDRVATMTYPDGEVITYDYNTQGLPEALSSSLGESLVQTANHNEMGQFTSLSLGNGRTTTYSYAPLNFRLESLATDGGLQDLHYNYDDVGNILSIVDGIASQTQRFDYDSLDRLVRAHTTVSGEEWSYDRHYTYNEIGNLTSKGGVTYTYPASGPDSLRPHAATSMGSNSYQYDDNGNMVLRVENGVTYTQEFDLENRLVRVISGTLEIAFIYDGDGMRVARVTSEGTTVYIGDYYEAFSAGPPESGGGQAQQVARVMRDVPRRQGSRLAAPLPVAHDPSRNNRVSAAAPERPLMGSYMNIQEAGYYKVTIYAADPVSVPSWDVYVSRPFVQKIGRYVGQWLDLGYLYPGTEVRLEVRTSPQEIQHGGCHDCTAESRVFESIGGNADVHRDSATLWRISFGILDKYNCHCTCSGWSGCAEFWNLNDDVWLRLERYSRATVNLGTPANGAWQTNRTVHFTWTGVPGDGGAITAYQIELENIGTYQTTNQYYDYTYAQDYGQNRRWRVRAQDSYGWGPWTAYRTFGIDTFGPSTSITSPAANACLRGTVEISGATTDSNSGVNRVERRIDSGSWSYVSNSSPWSFNWNTANWSDGAHTVYVRGQDVASNWGNAASRGYGVDNTAPPVPVMQEEGAYTAGISNTVSWYAVTDGGCAGGVEYQARRSGSVDCSSSQDQSDWKTSTSHTFSGLTSGQTYYYCARSQDALGNVSAWSAAVSSTQDADPPPVPAMNSSNACTAGTNYIASWSSVTDAGVGGVEYQARRSGSAACSSSQDESGWKTTTTHTFSGLSSGQTYYYCVRSRDAFGNTSDWSASASSTQDADPPPVPTMITEDPYTAGTSNTVNWQAVAGDVGCAGGVEYQVRRSGSANCSTSQEQSGWKTDTSHTFYNLTSGQTYYYCARSRDAFGNVSDWSVPTSSTQDADNPTGWTLVEPAGWETGTRRPDVQAQVTDSVSGVDADAIAYRYSRDGGTSWVDGWHNATCISGCAAGQTASLQASDVPFDQDSVDQNVIQFRASDVAGNTSYGTFTIPIDAQQPVVQLVSISEDNPYAYVVNDLVYYGVGSGSFNVDVSAADATAGLEEIAFPATTSTGGVYLQHGVPAAAASHSYSFDAASSFHGSPSVTATDQAGNLGTAPFSVERDALAPTVVMTATGSPTITLEWSGDDGDGAGVAGYDLEVSDGGSEWQRLLTNTLCTSYEYVGQPGHAYTFRVLATDNVGNVGEGEISVSVPAQVIKYYTFGGQRVAMRSGDGMYYLHIDHLGSTSLLSYGSGPQVGQAVEGSRVSYYPYGEIRAGDVISLPTQFGFTGQRLEAVIGLYDYHARWYDPKLGRFISADSIVPNPGNPQDLNRYIYVQNNPLKYIDPTGHQQLFPMIEGMWGIGYQGEYDYPMLETVFPFNVSASGLGWSWLTEQGSEYWVFDERHNLTQYLRRDEGVNRARAQFYQKMQEGRLTNGTDDYYSHRYVPWDYVREFGEYLVGYDKLGFFLGSYGVYSHLNPDNTVTFTVEDPKTCASASRSPLYYAPYVINLVLPKSMELRYSNYSIEGLLVEGQRPNLAGVLFGPKSVFEPRRRSDPGLFGSDIRLGGYVTLVFFWTEPLQVDQEQ